MRFKPIPLFFMAVLVFSACASFRGRAPGPEDFRNIARLNPFYTYLKMSGTARIKTPDGWIRSKAAVLVGAPYSMKVILTDPTGSAWFAATANEREVFYAIPGEGIRKILPRVNGGLIRLGAIRVSSDDLVRHIHPGVDIPGLEAGGARLFKDGIRSTVGGVTERFVFGSGGRLVKAVVQRPGGAPVRFEYSYTKGGYGVDINGRLRFEFKSVKPVDFIPDRVFEPLAAQ